MGNREVVYEIECRGSVIGSGHCPESHMTSTVSIFGTVVVDVEVDVHVHVVVIVDVDVDGF